MLNMAGGVVGLVVGLVVVVLVMLVLWRRQDHRADHRAWQQLADCRAQPPVVFDESMLAGLPEPAQRYFRFTIKPGAPLYTAAEISMQGDFSLGSKQRPDYLPMWAEQILAPPNGFVWKLKCGKGLMRISGSDAAIAGKSWSRFWLFDLLPVARAGGNFDHLRSAFGRCAGEALIWAPAAALPGESVSWVPLDENSARVIFTDRHLQQAVELTVGADGRPLKVLFQRWSNANDEKTFRLQPFGGYLSEFQSFDGYTLPTCVEAGNHFETANYFAFFKVKVSAIQFPRANQRE